MAVVTQLSMPPLTKTTARSMCVAYANALDLPTCTGHGPDGYYPLVVSDYPRGGSAEQWYGEKLAVNGN